MVNDHLQVLTKLVWLKARSICVVVVVVGSSKLSCRTYARYFEKKTDLIIDIHVLHSGILQKIDIFIHVEIRVHSTS